MTWQFFYLILHMTKNEILAKLLSLLGRRALIYIYVHILREISESTTLKHGCLLLHISVTLILTNKRVLSYIFSS